MSRSPLPEEFVYSTLMADFVAYMVEKERWDTDDILHFLSKPWKWTPEFLEWKEKEQSEPTECETECARGGPENCNGCMD